MTKNLKKLAAFALMAATMMSATMAQEAQQSSADNKKIEFSIHLGGNVPLGFWEDEEPDRIGYADIGLPLKSTSYDDGTYYGDADIGFNLGIKLKYHIPTIKGLGVIATADMFHNTAFYDLLTSKPEKDEHPSYINSAVMLGANYNYDVNDKLSFWAEAGMGLNLRIITTYVNSSKLSFGSYVPLTDSKYTHDYDNALTFAFQGGIGLKLMNKISIGLHYYNLGNAIQKGTYTFEGYDIFENIDNIENVTGERIRVEKPFETDVLSTSMFVFRIGYHF